MQTLMTIQPAHKMHLMMASPWHRDNAKACCCLSQLIVCHGMGKCRQRQGLFRATYAVLDKLRSGHIARRRPPAKQSA